MVNERGRGRPISDKTLRQREAMELLERFERGELVEAVEGDDETYLTPKNKTAVVDGGMQDVAEHFALARFTDVLQTEGKKIIAPLKKEVSELSAMLDKVKKANIITIQMPEIELTLNQMVHKNFESLLRLVSAGIYPMLIGPAGSTKTSAAKLVAETLGLPYYVQPVNAQTSKSDLMGYSSAGGSYIRSSFRDAYEYGGVYVMDEIDAGNANVLTVLNGALAGDDALFQDRILVPKHENFRFVATANTWGHGANREFVGRNSLDAATLDRFAQLDWPIDELLEWSFVDGYKYGDQWHKVVTSVRKYVYTNKVQMQVSPRLTIRGAQMFEVGFTVDQCIEILITNTAPEQHKIRIKDTAYAAWKA